MQGLIRPAHCSWCPTRHMNYASSLAAWCPVEFQTIPGQECYNVDQKSYQTSQIGRKWIVLISMLYGMYITLWVREQHLRKQMERWMTRFGQAFSIYFKAWPVFKLVISRHGLIMPAKSCPPNHPAYAGLYNSSHEWSNERSELTLFLCIHQMTTSEYMAIHSSRMQQVHKTLFGSNGVVTNSYDCGTKTMCNTMHQAVRSKLMFYCWPTTIINLKHNRNDVLWMLGCIIPQIHWNLKLWHNNVHGVINVMFVFTNTLSMQWSPRPHKPLMSIIIYNVISWHHYCNVSVRGIG